LSFRRDLHAWWPCGGQFLDGYQNPTLGRNAHGVWPAPGRDTPSPPMGDIFTRDFESRRYLAHWTKLSQKIGMFHAA